jgi:signal transduction histidine kinase/CheY-like chemotaxis protein
VENLTLTNKVTKVFLRFLALGDKPTDGVEEKLRHQFLIIMGLVMSMGGLFWGSFTVYFGYPIHASIPFGYSVMTYINFVFFYMTKNFKAVRFFQVSISLALPFIFQWILGGFVPSGAMMMWAMFSLVASLTFSDIKLSMGLLIAFEILTVFSGLIDSTVFSLFRVAISPAFNTVLFAANIFVVAAAVFGATIYYFARHEKARRDLIEAEKRAEAANRAKSIFLANMSHELRTPLNAVLGFSQILERDTSLGTKQREQLSIINSSGEHLLNLINDVLEMSKIEAGQHELNLDTFDLFRLLDDVSNMMRVRTDHKGIVLKVITASNVPQYISADEKKIRQILINLIGNSSKFTKDGGIVVRIAFDPDASQLVYEVEDTGEGISQEQQKTLFDPFTQTDSGRKAASGTGLGLAITRDYVQLMGGQINVKSVSGQGTTFFFNIPIQISTERQVVRQDIEKLYTAVSPEHNPHNYRILIVDDEPHNRMLLKEWLTAMKFDVYEAENGKQALELWEAWCPHLIWMDIRMPVMDGFEAIRQIKLRDTGSSTKLIALTASALDHERQQIVNCGADDFVRKPVREFAIYDTIEKHLGIKFIEEALAAKPGLKADDLPVDLQSLTSQQRQKISRAVAEYDQEMAEEVINELQKTQPHIAQYLGERVSRFDYDTIASFLRDVEHE